MFFLNSIKIEFTIDKRSHHNSNPYAKSKRLLLRQQGQAPSVIAYADKGSKRIKQKIAKLERNGKPANVATMAGARELSCFIWGMMTGNIA